MLVCLQSTEALGCFLRGGGGPSQGHRGRAPVFDVAADPAHRAHDILDDVGAGERAAQFAREAEPCDGEHLVDPFQDRSGNAVPVPFETAGEIANERSGPFGVVHFPSLPQDAPHRSVHRFWQPLQKALSRSRSFTCQPRCAPKDRAKENQSFGVLDGTRDPPKMAYSWRV